MTANELVDSIRAAEDLALGVFNQRNGVVDYGLPGVAHLFTPIYFGNFRQFEIKLTCTVRRTYKKKLRYDFKINDKRVACKDILKTYQTLGAFA
jgi:hypothetical protein